MPPSSYSINVLEPAKHVKIITPVVVVLKNFNDNIKKISKGVAVFVCLKGA